MSGKFARSMWLFFLLFIIILLFNLNDMSNVFRPAPDVDTLEFNQPIDHYESIPVVMSTDEKINVDVFDRVHPAVVNITATTLSMNFWMEIIPNEGQGSGFIIDSMGYILTNNHVVANAQKVIVTLSGGRKIPASLVGRDPTSDLAVIKIPSGSVDEAVTLGDSDQIRVGQKAIAIGNPFGLSHTLTTGIVSAIGRSIKTSENTQIDDLIQTDAAINPGNSGGPLLNSSGEVIGINTAIFSLSGGYQGIGFAIPINRAKDVATQLITTGRVARPWLGITGISVTPVLARELYLDVDNGVMVVEVISGSPADEAGLRGGRRSAIISGMRVLLGGDIITAINSVEVSDMEGMVRTLNEFNVGETIFVQVYRDRRTVEVPVVLSEIPYGS
ncbi:MAG: trypsin-like peptidase domain-containing protein [Deltaproteobacteria bacterium]|nr:trypsin-like peptidase domain-containing protein [Deltaproteobacteria bacterium]